MSIFGGWHGDVYVDSSDDEAHHERESGVPLVHRVTASGHSYFEDASDDEAEVSRLPPPPPPLSVPLPPPPPTLPPPQQVEALAGPSQLCHRSDQWSRFQKAYKKKDGKYQLSAAGANSPLSNASIEKIFDAMHLGPESSFIDLGSGIGYTTLYAWATRCVRVAVGVEMVKEYVDMANDARVQFFESSPGVTFVQKTLFVEHDPHPYAVPAGITHVYCFHTNATSLELEAQELLRMLDAQQQWQYLAVVAKMKSALLRVMEDGTALSFEFEEPFKVQSCCNMQGTGAGNFTIYVLKRKSSTQRTLPPPDASVDDGGAEIQGAGPRASPPPSPPRRGETEFEREMRLFEESERRAEEDTRRWALERAREIAARPLPFAAAPSAAQSEHSSEDEDEEEADESGSDSEYRQPYHHQKRRGAKDAAKQDPKMSRLGAAFHTLQL